MGPLLPERVEVLRSQPFHSCGSLRGIPLSKTVQTLLNDTKRISEKISKQKKNDLPGRPEFYLELELNCL